MKTQRKSGRPVYRAEPEVELVAAPFVPLDINRRIGGQLPALAHLKTPAREFITLGLPMAGEFMAREAA
jgi:hypothetical protein